MFGMGSGGLQGSGVSIRKRLLYASHLKRSGWLRHAGGFSHWREPTSSALARSPSRNASSSMRICHKAFKQKVSSR
jgi:hypothetical protein